MRNVLFDLSATQPNVSGKRHGGGIYGEIVLRRIAARGLPVRCFYDGSKWLNPEMRTLVDGYGIPLHDMGDTTLAQMVSDHAIDVIYSCLPQPEVMRFDGCDVIGTRHGMRALEQPYDSIFWSYRHRLTACAKFLACKYFPGVALRRKRAFGDCLRLNPRFRFVTVSEHSRAVLHALFPQFDQADIKVFYSPSTTTRQTEGRVHEADYFLMVSGNRWSKNNLRGIMALDALFSRGLLAGYRAKITGAKDASAFRYRLRNPGRFEFLGYVDDSELDQLYHDAYCLLYPSLNEGFGYPPLEAMHYGTPVLTSAISSIPEVCGDAAIYFSPFSLLEIESRLLQVADPDVHADYRARALQRYAQVTARQERDLDALIDYIYDL